MEMNTASLPVTRDLSQSYLLSRIVVILMVAASLVGLLFQSSLYPTESLQQAFVSNDLVNLFIGLPILFGSMRFTERGKLIGLLFWPGALFYITYNYVAYAAAMPFTLPFVFDLILASLSVYTIFVLLSSIDAFAVQQQLEGVVPETPGRRSVGGIWNPVFRAGHCSGCVYSRRSISARWTRSCHIGDRPADHTVLGSLRDSSLAQKTPRLCHRSRIVIPSQYVVHRTSHLCVY